MASGTRIDQNPAFFCLGNWQLLRDIHKQNFLLHQILNCQDVPQSQTIAWARRNKTQHHSGWLIEVGMTSRSLLHKDYFLIFFIGTDSALVKRWGSEPSQMLRDFRSSFKYLEFVHPEPCEHDPNLTSIFFKWGEKNHQLVMYAYWIFCINSSLEPWQVSCGKDRLGGRRRWPWSHQDALNESCLFA